MNRVKSVKTNATSRPPIIAARVLNYLFRDWLPEIIEHLVAISIAIIVISSKALAGGIHLMSSSEFPLTGVASPRSAKKFKEKIRVTRKQRRMVQECQDTWRRLALSLLSSQQLGKCWAIGITSAIRGEGRSTSSIGLATALAQETDQHVLLVECDFTRPNVARDFDVEQAPGLAQHLFGRRTIDSVLKPTSLRNLTLLPAGTGVKGQNGSTNSNHVLRTKLAPAISELKQKFPYIVIDLPPVLGDLATVELSNALDGVVLVVRSGVTPREKIKEAFQMIKDVRVLGTIHFGSGSALPKWLLNLISE